MGVNNVNSLTYNSYGKLIIDGRTIFDYSDANALPENVESGFKFVNKNGEIKTGTATIFKFLSGDSEPANTLGENGNFYLEV